MMCVHPLLTIFFFFTQNEARRNARRDIAQISHDLEESEAQLKSSIESKEMAESQVDNLQQKIQSLEHARHEEKQNCSFSSTFPLIPPP